MHTTKNWSGLPDGFRARPTRIEDVEEAVNLFNTCSMAMIGTTDHEAEVLRKDWQTPNFELSTNTRAVLNPEGRMVGIAEVWDVVHPPVHPFLFGRVLPDYEGLGIGSEMLKWSIDRSKQVMLRVPEDARISVRAFAVSHYDPSKKLLEDHGFHRYRSSWQMVIDLDKTLPEPIWPEGIHLQPYHHKRDGEAVYLADADAFRDHWGFIQEPFEHGYERWLHSMIQDEEYDPDLWFIALKGTDIAGASICRRRSWEAEDAGWVRSLFVRRPYRRQGLALALLHHSFREFQRRGKRQVCLGVDSKNLTGATRLYEKAGMRIKRQYDQYELELRRGNELAKT
jgi:mycothiol synthase